MHRQVNVRVSESMLADLAKIAEGNCRSVSAEIRKAIVDHIAKEQGQKPRN